MIADLAQMVVDRITAVTGVRTLALLVIAFALFNICALFATFGGWFERKLIARVHSRRGPVYTGPFGILQTVADLLKFLRKEIIFPKGSDRALFILAPLLMTVPSFLSLIVIPFASLVVVRSEYSLLLALALLSVGPIAVLVGSWASNSKYSTLGGLRAAGMTMSYEVLLGIAVASVILTAKSFDIVAIVEHQHAAGMWMVVQQPVVFVLFLIALIASVERNPFDLVEAESELVSGWKTEYGGVYFSITLLAEYIKLLASSMLFVAIFLGGWMDAGGEIGFFAKTFAIVLLMIYIRATAFRMRLDQVFAKIWTRFVPLALLNFVITAGVLL